MPQTGWLTNDRHLCLTVSETRRIMVSAQSLRGPSSWFVAGPFLLCPHVMERARDLSGASFYKALILFMRAPLAGLSTSQRPHILNHHPLAVRISTHEFGRYGLDLYRGCRICFQDGALRWLASWCWLLAARLCFSPCVFFCRALWVASWHSSLSFTGASSHLSTSCWSLQSSLFQGEQSCKLMFYWRLETWGWIGNAGREGEVAKNGKAFSIA